MHRFLRGCGRLLVLCVAAALPVAALWMPAKAWKLPGGAHRAPTATAAPTAFETPLAAAEQTPPLSAPTVPPKKAGGGTVVEEQLGGGTTLADNLTYKNRDGLSVDFAAFLNKKPKTVLKKGDLPQVLILHTHTTEAYMTYYAGYYNKADMGRSTDTDKTVVAAGEALATALRAKGIAVVHDVTVHDDPEYVGAYYRSADTADAVCKQYPSIRLVIDLHRDAIQRSDTVAIKPTVTAGGESYAQMMLVVGGENTKDNPNKHRDENVAVAFALQRALQTAVPGIMRPISFCACEYNQSLHPGFLVEVGAQVNTVAEAQHSAAVLGEAIAAVLGA